MVVDSNGGSYGTIGGGLLEATAIKEAGIALDQRRSRLMNFSFTGENANSSGMICGGKAVLLLDYLAASDELKDFFRHWFDAVSGGTAVCSLTVFKGVDEDFDVIGRSLFGAGGQVAGNYSWTEHDLQKLRPVMDNASETTVKTLDNVSVVIDPVRKVKTLYCFGAGHVAVPTARLAALVGFHVVVVDDRADFANTERFPEAGNVIVTPDFNSVMDELDIDSDSFIVIVTREHLYDRVVLAQALRTQAGYIGMISSRKKREIIYNALREEGFASEALDKVHSPIGLSIGAETPEEIAVSIVAELIAERSRQH